MEERTKELFELGYKTQKEISWERLHLYFETKMKEILNKDREDPEEEHREADDLLCELLKTLGFDDLITIYEKIGKWYA